ncbi:MAG: aminopeptidase [Flavobacteriaceae bacterium]
MFLRRFLLFFSLFSLAVLQAQQGNKMDLQVRLNDSLHRLEISQTIEIQLEDDFDNDHYWLHNWANAYSSNQSPLAKRFLENYSNNFHFASEKFRGSSSIHSIVSEGELLDFKIPSKAIDLVQIPVSSGQLEARKIELKLTYHVDLPRDRFTGYGWSKNGYTLKYWYISPAVYRDGEWKTMSNLDMNDLLTDYYDYSIEFSSPSYYALFSDLDSELNNEGKTNHYHLKAKQRTQVELALSRYFEFYQINTSSVNLVTNMDALNLDPGLIQDLADRQLNFLAAKVGPVNRDQLLVNKLDYYYNPVYGFNQLPNFLAPFQDTFLWDIKMLKVLTKRYLEESFIWDTRKDAWFMDATQMYIMMQYIDKYYPDAKALGQVSKLPLFKHYYLASLGFNEKYLTIYQYIARQGLDQSLTTPSADLSNFNRKITNKYKGALGLNYLNAYLGEDQLQNELKDYLEASHGDYLSTEDFQGQLSASSNKETDWFFQDFLQSNKKINFKLKKVVDDSLIVIKNKSEYSPPVLVSSFKKDSLINSFWTSSAFDSISIPKDESDRIALNYGGLAPEVRQDDNWKKKKASLLNKPLDFKLLKDLDDPDKNQIFYTPEILYNYYDGITLGLGLSNKTLLAQNFLLKVTPSYGIKSSSFTGSFGGRYQFMPRKTNIRSVYFGAAGSYFHYAPDLAYKKLTPYLGIKFKRKSLRDVGGSGIALSYTHVDKQPNPAVVSPDEINKYGVVNLNYSYSKPALIDDLRYSANIQYEESFTKASFDFRYRYLTDKKRQLDFRFFVGGFLRNETQSDYFSFALDRPTNYLFNYDFLGTSETTGFFSQQIIIAEGGFKSDVGMPYANQWMTTFNSSVALWRWVEVYGDVGFLKNRSQPVFFAYDSGVRLNFVHNILELYFPLYSNNGWETGQAGYAEKIRFVLTLNPGAIFSFIRRGFI